MTPARRPSPMVRATAAALALLSATAVAAEEPWRFAGGSRTVVVGDVHGAYRELVGLLQAAGIVDRELQWSGGDARLVSLGDLLDRGGDSRKVMDLLMRLERDAAAHGGAVHVVLGNHEVMNLLGDLRYVAPAEYAAFAADEREGERAAAYERFVQRLPEPLGPSDAMAEFERRYPPGYFAHRRAFAPDGAYGAWLLTLPAVIVVGDSAFVHGGLSPLMQSETAGQINARLRETLQRYLAVRASLAAAAVLPIDDMRQDLELTRAALAELPVAGAEQTPLGARLRELWALSHAPELGPEGPLWYRGSVLCNPLLERPVLEAALDRLRASRAVVGHTPTDDRRVRALHGGRLIVLDTGMTPSYRGRAAALVIAEDDITVQYLGMDRRVAPERDRLEAHGLRAAELLTALSTGEVDVDAAAPVGSRQVRVRGTGTLLATLYSGRAADLELAAHALDRLLEWQLVPPTVARDVNGRYGALQLRYPDGFTEAQRMETGRAPGEWCSLQPQLDLMHVFDALLGIPVRAPEEIVHRQQTSTLKLTGHERAFRARGGRVPRGLALTAAMIDSLAALDRRALDSALGRWLNEKEIDAVLTRRDALLAMGRSSEQREAVRGSVARRNLQGR